jgi:hypothetical protein
MTRQSSELKRLVAELAVAVAEFMRNAVHDIDEDGYIYHYFQGPFDENCYTVWQLGGAWAAPTSGNQGIAYRDWCDQVREEAEEAGSFAFIQHPGSFRFMQPDEIRAIVMGHEEIAPQLVSRLLDAYLRSMADYSWQGAQLDVSGEPFTPEPIFEPQIRAFVDSGYIERSGAMVRWTNKISPAMRAAGLWDENMAAPKPQPIIFPAETREHLELLIRQGHRGAAIIAIRMLAKIDDAYAEHCVEDIERHMARG